MVEAIGYVRQSTLKQQSLLQYLARSLYNMSSSQVNSHVSLMMQCATPTIFNMPSNLQSGLANFRFQQEENFLVVRLTWHLLEYSILDLNNGISK